MGIINKLKEAWKEKTVEEKVGFFFDIVATIGGGLIGTDLGKKFSEGHHPIAGFFIKITTAGLGMAAGDLSAKKLRESYAEPIGRIADTLKAKAEKEAADEQRA